LSYTANYDATDLTHSNYRVYTYRGSAVENITITGDFTAQDSAEATYMLAVIHFFRSMTKMFYGQDTNPKNGVPPPLCYLSGHGEYQFNQHPMAITSFTYSLPQDVDYINAYPTQTGGPNTIGAEGSAIGGVNLAPYNQAIQTYSTPAQRLFGSNLRPGGYKPPVKFTNASQNINQITRVPTKITLAITCIPIITRNAISNEFSLARYASGNLLLGSTNNTGGGIW